MSLRRLLIIPGLAAAVLLASIGTAVSTANSRFTADYHLTTQSGQDVEWKCAGVRIDNDGQGLRDVEECSLSGPGTAEYVPGDYIGNPGPSPGFPASVTDFFWSSDFDGMVAIWVDVKVNGNSSRAHVNATY
jgi:hypothetical protein